MGETQIDHRLSLTNPMIPRRSPWSPMLVDLHHSNGENQRIRFPHGLPKIPGRLLINP